ncbi:MAG: SusD/RagB family nutrient-binding outer membrane lipoprotein [Bacteroidales bacterium]|nr:SusD/RagB family nutrient-binding outer membrane lipoprotein [Bacteroidales bacterium]
MRKAIYILFTSILILANWSCSEKIMDEINENVNDPTEMVSRLIITDVMTNTAFSVAGGDFNYYASIYIEHNVGIFGQFYNAEIRSGEPTSSTTYNNSWDAVYQNLYNLKVIIQKCSEGGTETGNWHTLGVAQILSAYNLAIVTDVMGDVPWSEALQPGIIFTPVLDRQDAIYGEVIRLLDEAILNLDKESVFPSLGTQDLIYGGDIASWKKFAYGLKARYAMHLSLKTPDYSNVIAYADQSFTAGSEQAQFNYNGTSASSPFYRMYTDRDYYGASQSLHDKLTERNDPRDNLFFMPHPLSGSNDIVFAPNGTPNQVQGIYSISAITNATAPTYLLSYHEIEFLKAEAYVRLNDLPNADTALRRAVTAAFMKENIGLSAADAVDYFNTNVRPRFQTNPLSEVMNQKYIAFYEEEALEAYIDFRRLKAMGNNVVSLDNPMNTNLFPLRYTYGSEDVTTNFNVRDAYGDGTYVYSENVWWAGGTR